MHGIIVLLEFRWMEGNDTCVARKKGMNEEIGKLVRQVIEKKKQSESLAEIEARVLSSNKMPENCVELLILLGGGHGGKGQLAADLGRTYWEVKNWLRRNYIPEWAWGDIMRLAAQRSILGVTTSYLHKICKRGEIIRPRGKYLRSGGKRKAEDQ
jgi:hypothetical protein